MKLKTKKGITVVEVIISSVLITLIVGVTASMFLTGNNIYYEGAGVSKSFSDCATVETYLQRNLMRAQRDPIISQTSDLDDGSIWYGDADDIDTLDAGEIAFYFDDNDVFTVKTAKLQNGTVSTTTSTFKNITGLEIKVTPTDTKKDAPFKADYVIEGESNYKLSGGIVMPNTKYDSSTYSPSDPYTIPADEHKCIIINTSPKVVE